MSDVAYCCPLCVSQAAENLSRVTEYTPAARDVAQGQSRRSGGGGSGKPGSRLPLDLGAMARLMAVQGELTTWARHVAEERGMPAWDGSESPDYLIRAARYLAAHLEWMRHRPEADEFMTDVDACARVMRGLARGPAEQRYLGPCEAEVPPSVADGRCLEGVPAQAEDGKVVHSLIGEPCRAYGECEGDVYGHMGGHMGTCRTCGAHVNQDERRAWLDAEVRGWAYRAAEIAEAYGVNVKTIRSWAGRGQLVAHGHDAQERPLYNLGEVLDLAAGDAARREEARATRARRAAAKAAESEEAA